MIEKTLTEKKFEIALLLYKNNQFNIDYDVSSDTETLICSTIDCHKCFAKEICRSLDDEEEYNIGCLNNNELEEFFLLYPEVKLIC